MLALLSLVSASAAGCGFNGGAFIGAHAGFVYQNLKELAKESPAKKEDVSKALGVLLSTDDTKYTAAYDAATAASKKTYDDATAGLKDGVLTIKVDASGIAAGADAIKSASSLLVEEIKKAANTVVDYTKVTDVRVLVLAKDATVGATFTAAALRDAEAWKNFNKDDAKTAFVKARTDADAEVKNTANTGLIGLHVGYLAKMNQFGLGALLEGNWSLGQDMKKDGTSVKDFNARFGANILARAVYFLAHNAFVGVDAGIALQEFRLPKETKTDNKDDKESKWVWGPMARAVVGYAINDNLAVTLTAGGVIPIKQDWKDSRKVKYYNLQGNLGVSYFFGG